MHTIITSITQGPPEYGRSCDHSEQVDMITLTVDLGGFDIQHMPQTNTIVTSIIIALLLLH